MKIMFFAVSVLMLLTACHKEDIPVNYLPGDWGLVQTDLFESGELSGSNTSEEINTVYSFSGCEAGSCSMYIDEDGERTYYTYAYDPLKSEIVLDGQSIFQVKFLNESVLELSRTYDVYTSTYHFIRSR